MLALFKSMGQSQESRCGHAVTRIGVQTGNVDRHLAGRDRKRYADQNTYHENGGKHARRRVQRVQPSSHTYCARYASMICLPSSPARFSHSSSMVSPTLSSPAISSSEGLTISMPFLARLSRYHCVFSRESSQPRFSAASAAFSNASRVLSSSASKAFLFTRMAFLGSHACVS